MRIRIKRIFLWSCVLAVMWVIFFFSSQNAEASAGTSDGLIGRLLSALKPGFDGLSPEARQKMIDGLSFIVRKAAHFSVYCLLGMLCSGAVSTHTKKRPLIAITAGIICAAYAVSDEIHQYFVPGRSCEIRDIIIDSAGAALGIAAVISLIIISRRKNRIKHITDKLNHADT